MGKNNTTSPEDANKAKEELQGKAQETKEHAKNTAREAKEDLKGAAQDAKQEMKGAAQDLKQEAMSIKDQVQEQLQASVQEQRERAANELHGFAEAFRKTGNELRDQEYGFVANYAEQLADRIEQVSDFIENREIGQYVENIEDFARRQPLLFVGSATVLGVLVARLLKSSSSQVAQSARNERSTQSSRGANTQLGRTSQYGSR